jgi:membrane dipeptidase
MDRSQKHFGFLIASTLLALPLFSVERSPAEADRVTRRVLDRAIVIDTHADTPQLMLDEGYDLADPASPYMISLPKMREGHLGAEFFSIWVDTAWPPQDFLRRALDLIDVVNAQLARHSDALEPARTADDIVRIHQKQKIAILMGVEGGHIIENDLRMLDILYRLGVRYMTLTHTKNTSWADSSGDTPHSNGLTDFGRQVVERMNRVGMMVDVSHTSDKTFFDTLAVAKAPIIASHSSCRALCNAPRDLTDEMIRALAKNGGIIDINFYPAFIDQTYRDANAKVSKQEDAALEAARKAYAAKGKWVSFGEEVRLMKPFVSGLPMPGYELIADHIDHAVQVGGVDHVGLGSDFDGIYSAPRGMEDVSKLPSLVRELARRGYSEGDLQKILGGNLLRVMREVEGAARKLQTEKGGE